MKALGALTVAICQLEGLPEPQTFYVTELERSLTVRRAYRIFYTDVDPTHDPSSGPIGPRLRRAATSIAKLCGRPIYPSMRVHDRYSLRMIQQRLQAWLAPNDSDPRLVEAAGVRLFQDIAHLTELMLGVNERPELRLHDARISASVAESLERGDIDVPGAIEALAVIKGRDANLDAMLASATLPSMAALLARLRELTQQLTPRKSSVSGPIDAVTELPEGDDFI